MPQADPTEPTSSGRRKEKDPSKGRSKGSEFHEEGGNRRITLKISGEESGKIHSRRKRG